MNSLRLPSESVVLILDDDTILKLAFREPVDDYLAFCEESGIEPEKPFSGKLVLRMKPELHRTLSIAARKENKSLNALITDRLS